MGEDISVEPFRGDWDELQRMAIASWRDEYGIASFPDLYHPGFTRFLVEGAPPDHLIAAYDRERCVAFLANLPRRVRLHGVDARACLAGLLTSRKDYLRQGIAERMIRSALKLNDRYGYQLVYFYLESGHRSTRLFRKLTAQGERIVPLKKIYVWGRVLDLPRVQRSEGLKGWEAAALRLLGHGRPLADVAVEGLRRYRPDDLGDCMALAARVAERADLARRFETAELAHWLESPRTHTLVVERANAITAFVNWIDHVHLGAQPERWAWMAHAAVDELPRREAGRLYRAWLAQLAKEGVVGALEWGMGYHRRGPLWRSRFVPYPRSVTLYAWLFDRALDARPLGSLFDVQV
jgi:predicted N-acetyltransferase YhbS